MSLIAKIQQQSLLQNKLQAQLAEMSYQAVNGTRQAPRNFREGTLEIGKMHFSTPQDRITKEMIMDYQKTEQERHFDDSSGTLKKYAPTGLSDTLETEKLTPFDGVATGATEENVRTYETDFITLHRELTALKERLENKTKEKDNKAKEFYVKEAEYKGIKAQLDKTNDQLIKQKKELTDIQNNIATLTPATTLGIVPSSPSPELTRLEKKETEKLALIASIEVLVLTTLPTRLTVIEAAMKKIEADYHVIEAEVDKLEITDIPDKETEITTKDLEVVKIKENVKSNKEEIQRVKILNKDITQRYTDKFNMANRDRFSVMQDPNESDGDYLARIKQIEGTEYKPEIYKEKAANEGNLKLMSNLRNSLRDEVKISEIVKTFLPEEVFIINTNWKSIQDQLKVKFGINNPDKNVTDYVTEIRDVVETLQTKPFGTTLLPADSASKSSGATSTPTGPTTPLVHDDGTASDFIATVENDALYIQNTAVGEAIWIKLAAKTAKGAVYIVFSDRNADDSFKTFKFSGTDKFAYKEMLKDLKLSDSSNLDIKRQLLGSSNIKDWVITHLKTKLSVVQAKNVIVEGKTMVGAGLLLPNKETITKHANFGKNIILLDKLYYKNVLSIKDKRMHSVEHLPNVKVSDTLADIIISMCKNEHPTKQTLDTLNLDERKLFDLLLYVSGLRKSRHVNKIENTAAKDANIKELKKRFKTVEAEIQAGNNNPIVKAELKEIVNKLVLYHVISQNNGKKYLQQY